MRWGRARCRACRGPARPVSRRPRQFRDATCRGTLAGNVFTTAPVIGDCEVDATFVVDPADVIFRDGFEAD